MLIFKFHLSIYRNRLMKFVLKTYTKVQNPKNFLGKEQSGYQTVQTILFKGNNRTKSQNNANYWNNWKNDQVLKKD